MTREERRAVQLATIRELRQRLMEVAVRRLQKHQTFTFGMVERELAGLQAELERTEG